VICEGRESAQPRIRMSAKISRIQWDLSIERHPRYKM
jgi:hypothetical protein